MTNWVLFFDEESFLTVQNDSTGEYFKWFGEKLIDERKKYVKEHKKYLRYLERCEKGSKNEKEKTMKHHDKHNRMIRIVNYQFHCASKEIIERALDNDIKKIIIRKPDYKDRRFKKDDFGTFKLEWFYQKLNYKAKNVGIQLEYNEAKLHEEEKTS